MSQPDLIFWRTAHRLIHTFGNTNVRTHSLTCTHARTHTSTYTHTHIHTHTHTHTNTHSWVQMLEKEGKIAKFIPVDFTDAETVFERCMQVGVCGWVGV